jgi:cbb3-type cytochrome oxidase subunit 3
MSIKDTISAKLTTQSALITLLGVVAGVVYQQYNVYEDVPISSMIFNLVLIGMILIMLYQNKKLEMDNANKAMSEPDVLSTYLTRQEQLVASQQAWLEQCLAKIEAARKPEIIEKIVEVEVPVEKIIYVPQMPNLTSDNTTG